jgi:hypothetical protein
MVVNMRWFAGLHSPRWISVALRAVLMLSLMAITEVVRGEPSLLIMGLRSLRVGPFLVEGAFVVGWGAAAGADLADGGVLFFLDFFATCAQEGLAGWVALFLGGGGGGGGEDSKVDFGVSSRGGSGGAEPSHHSGDENLSWTEEMSFSRELR